MSELIALLESIGQDAEQRYAELGQAVAASTAGLAATSALCCFLAPGKEKEDEDAPAKDDDEIRGEFTLVRAA